MYGLKKRKFEKSKKLGNSYRDKNFFCFAILALFFVIFAFMQKFKYMYFFCKERLSLTRKESTKVLYYRRKILK